MNGDRTITVSELGVPDEAVISKLSPDDIRQILAQKVRRGFVICSTFFVIGAICLVLLIFFYQSKPFVIGGIVWLIFFKFLAMLSHQKMTLAQSISVEPRQVYWAHPCRPLIRSRLIKYEGTLTLHSRTGQSLEVAMSRAQMLNVVTWLKRQNSEIRIGAYDAH